MKLRYLVLLAITIPIFSSTKSFSTDSFDSLDKHSLSTPQGRVKFVKLFIPTDSSEDYAAKVADCYRDALGYKQEIMHDNRLNIAGQSMIMPNTVTYDYGWTFPPVPRVQKHLLEFCAQAKSPVNMMDIGAGYGLDSLFALLTKNIKMLYALEKQRAQCNLLKQCVEQSILTNVDPNFPLGGFKTFCKDFLSITPEFSKGAFHVLNANKVIHFGDIAETKIFGARFASLLGKQGRLFLTCLTPTPGSEIELFMKSQVGNEFPGFVFYRQKTELINHLGIGPIPGKSSILEVRTPTENEKGGYFYQTLLDENHVETHRVMHYHTAETLAKMLGDQFTLLETMITTPDENNGTDYMISIVAEKN